jgi:Type VI secretion system, TssN
MQSANLPQPEISITGHQWAIAEKIKTTLAWLVSVVAITIAAAYLFSSIAAIMGYATLKYIFVLFFLSGSISHIFIFPKWLPYLDDMAGFIYMLLLSAVISLAVFIVFVLSSFDGGMLPFTAGAAFMLPYAVHLCWHCYLAVYPLQIFKAWYLPADMEPQTKMSLLLNSIPFKLKIKLREKDEADIIFIVTLTGKLPVGNMFCRFLHDQQGAIESSNEKAEPYGWFFFVKRWYGIKALDPNKTLIENGIGANDLLIVKRSLQ